MLWPKLMGEGQQPTLKRGGGLFVTGDHQAETQQGPIGDALGGVQLQAGGWTRCPIRCLPTLDSINHGSYSHLPFFSLPTVATQRFLKITLTALGMGFKSGAIT